MAAYPARRRADGSAGDKRGREKDADDGADRGPAPAAVPGGHLVLVHVHLAGVVLGDHGGVIGPDRARRMQVLHHAVVVSRRRLAGVGADIDEHCLGLGHLVSSACWIHSVLWSAIARTRPQRPTRALAQPGSRPWNSGASPIKREIGRLAFQQAQLPGPAAAWPREPAPSLR